MTQTYKPGDLVTFKTTGDTVTHEGHVISRYQDALRGQTYIVQVSDFVIDRIAGSDNLWHVPATLITAS